MPIVAVTANAMREDFERCREAGMDDFVAKPVTLTALANAIERAVKVGREGAEPPPADTAAAPEGGVDMAALASLQEDLGGPDALARIIRLFLEQLDPQAEQIDASARGGEHETLARVAHRMRSSAATLGAVGTGGAPVVARGGGARRRRGRVRPAGGDVRRRGRHDARDLRGRAGGARQRALDRVIRRRGSGERSAVSWVPAAPGSRG